MTTHRQTDVLPAPIIGVPPPVRVAEPRWSHRPRDIAVDDPIFEPPFLGARVVSPIWIDEIVGYVNQQELFSRHWALQPEARESDPDAVRRGRGMLYERLAAAERQELLAPRVVYGYFPVNGAGGDLIVWTDDTRTEERVRLEFTRRRPAPYRSVADYFKPVGEPDYAALQIVTLGSKISTRLAGRYPGETDADHRRLRGLAIALTDALAEYWHRRIRIEWGFADEDGPTLNLLFRGFYRGQRYPLTGEHRAAAAELLRASEVEIAPSGGNSYNPEYTPASLIAHQPHAERLHVEV